MNRLNYNYYYFAFDVLRQSNYKMFKNEREGMKGRKKAGSLSIRSYKIEFMLVGISCLKSEALNVLLQITIS